MEGLVSSEEDGEMAGLMEKDGILISPFVCLSVVSSKTEIRIYQNF